MQRPEFPQNGIKTKVVGVGSGGLAAVDRMMEEGISGAEFIAVDSSPQPLMLSEAQHRLRLGDPGIISHYGGPSFEHLCRLAEEARGVIADLLEGARAVFLVAGMGGQTAPVVAPAVARVARCLGVLTVGVITRPFWFEGRIRSDVAAWGVSRLAGEVDALVVISADGLKAKLDRKGAIAHAFRRRTSGVLEGVRGISDMLALRSQWPLDLDEVRRALMMRWVAQMGVGYAKGRSGAEDAARRALASPFLEVDLDKARGILVNVTQGPGIIPPEAARAVAVIRQAALRDGQIAVGLFTNPKMEGEVKVTVIATGLELPADWLQMDTHRAMAMLNSWMAHYVLPLRPGQQEDPPWELM